MWLQSLYGHTGGVQLICAQSEVETLGDERTAIVSDFNSGGPARAHTAARALLRHSSYHLALAR
jgi:hypothetical protein